MIRAAPLLALHPTIDLAASNTYGLVRRSVSPAADGRFEIDLPAGTWNLAVRGMHNEALATAEPLSTHPGQTTTATITALPKPPDPGKPMPWGAASAATLGHEYTWAEGVITVGGVALTTGVILRLYAMLGRLMNQLNGMMRNFGTAQNSAEIVARPLGLVDAPDAKPLVVSNAAIRFDNVSFKYERSLPVIENLNLELKPGERVGLIGFSGREGREAELLALLEPLVSVYGEDWWFTSAHAFAQVEAGEIAAAERTIERSLRQAITRPGKPPPVPISSHAPLSAPANASN